MVTFKIALRSLMRRKVRMMLIGFLVVLGTMLIVFGETFALSAQHFSRLSIINYFTGDCIIYSEKSREKPSPFSFTTPLPLIDNPTEISRWLDSNSLVETHVAIAQNYGQMSIEKDGKKTDVPFIFYAVDPVKYRKTFPNAAMKKGTFYNTESSGSPSGVVLSQFQVENYAKNYGVEISVNDKVTLLSLNEGGSVNAYPSSVVGIYEPKYYANVFNYINFLDIESYSKLYNFTGVDGASLPDNVNSALAMESDDDIFGLASGTIDSLNTESLVSRELSGYSMIAVKLKKSTEIEQFRSELTKKGFSVSTALWNESAGFFAYTAKIIQAVIYGAAFLIFLIVIFILMNTQIINVLERTGEIGTLRAMGAEKSFIRSIFLWESFLLNGIASLIGMILSIILIVIVSSAGGVTLPEVMQQYLIGGGTLQLILSPQPFIEAFGILIFVSTIATLYPIRVATAVTPLKAMSGK